MSIVIGCSGSTGSSLLKTILNRHSQLFAGPEAGLFAFPSLYKKWAAQKKILLGKLKNDDWQMRKGMTLLQPVFGWQASELSDCITHSSSFKEFIYSYFAHTLRLHQKREWVAKTPANAAGLAAFLQYFPEGKVIHTVRNPYDTIASLMARGYNAYWATAYYVYNTAIASANRQHPRYYEVRYEELVQEPANTLVELFDFLEIPFEEKIITAKYEKRAEPTSMKGWKYQETATIGASSIGRFQELSIDQQALIQAAFTTFRIAPSFQKKKTISTVSGQELCTLLGYEFLKNEHNDYHLLLRSQYWKDRLGRIRHGFYHQFWDYPGALNLS